MSATLTPAAIARADYGIAQTPSLGGEIEVWASTDPSGVIKRIRCLGGAVYETKTYNAAGFGGVDLAVVGPAGLHCELVGLITVPDWAVNTSKKFPCGKAGEGAVPATPWTGAQRGDEMVQIQVPLYDPAAVAPKYFQVGATSEKRIKLPTRMSKAIADGLTSAEWVTPGKTEIGELTVGAMNLGHEEGLLKIAGLKTTVMLRVMRERALEVARIFLIDWTPTIDRHDPEGDGESTVTATGLFSRFAVLTAPGTAVEGG